MIYPFGRISANRSDYLWQPMLVDSRGRLRKGVGDDPLSGHPPQAWSDQRRDNIGHRRKSDFWGRNAISGSHVAQPAVQPTPARCPGCFMQMALPSILGRIFRSAMSSSERSLCISTRQSAVPEMET